MARVEGALRMKRVGKFMVLAGLASLVIGAITLVLYSMLGHYLKNSAMLLPASPVIAVIMMTYLGGLPLVAGGGLWVCGWIVEGFLGPQGFE